MRKSALGPRSAGALVGAVAGLAFPALIYVLQLVAGYLALGAEFLMVVLGNASAMGCAGWLLGRWATTTRSRVPGLVFGIPAVPIYFFITVLIGYWRRSRPISVACRPNRYGNQVSVGPEYVDRPGDSHLWNRAGT